MDSPGNVLGLPAPLMYAVFLPVALFLLLFLLRISRNLMSPMGADTIVLLIGVDVLVPTKQLEVKNILSLQGDANEIFMIFIIIGFLLVATSIWLEEVYYHAIDFLKREPGTELSKYAVTILVLLLTYIPSGMFMAMHVALFALYPAKHV